MPVVALSTTHGVRDGDGVCGVEGVGWDGVGPSAGGWWRVWNYRVPPNKLRDQRVCDNTKVAGYANPGTRADGTRGDTNLENAGRVWEGARVWANAEG